MAAKKALPDDDHVARFVPYKQQNRDPDTDEFLGVSSAAFALRESDKGGLSVTWIEFFGAYGLPSKVAAACALRASFDKKHIPTKAAFATGTVSSIRNLALRFRKTVRVVHAPVPGNPGHAEARHFTDEDLDLLDLFAIDAFTDVDLVAHMALPPVPPV